MGMWHSPVGCKAIMPHRGMAESAGVLITFLNSLISVQDRRNQLFLLPIMIHIVIDKGVATEPIYDAFTNEQLKIGDELRSIERGDTVRVFELGERWCGTADPVPTIWLEPLRTMPPKAFERRLSDHNGKHCLIAYTKAPL